MSLSTLVLRLTHTGVDKAGKPFTGSILIPDLETGLEYQGRKSAVYVPAGESITIPVANRVAFSMYSGAIKQFVEDGYLTAETLVDANGSTSPFGSTNPVYVTNQPSPVVYSSTTSGTIYHMEFPNPSELDTYLVNVNFDIIMTSGGTFVSPEVAQCRLVVGGVYPYGLTQNDVQWCSGAKGWAIPGIPSHRITGSFQSICKLKTEETYIWLDYVTESQGSSQVTVQSSSISIQKINASLVAPTSSADNHL